MSTTNFSVGDVVVYPSHGVGKIANTETQLIGEAKVDVYIIEFGRDKMEMRLKVPVTKVQKCGLRHIATKAEFESVVFQILKTKSRSKKTIMWNRRAQEYNYKINSGELTLIAEVVRDLFSCSVENDRSYSERITYDTAMQRLAAEFAVVIDVSVKDAIGLIEERLKLRAEVAA